ncbi:uncharacterized protein [Manis javanica]|uniref:uncharacterized protein n=1 Tax=Manis javanica TaxID=9974 RepID=UPI003C6D93F1
MALLPKVLCTSQLLGSPPPQLRRPLSRSPSTRLTHTPPSTSPDSFGSSVLVYRALSPLGFFASPSEEKISVHHVATRQAGIRFPFVEKNIEDVRRTVLFPTKVASKLRSQGHREETSREHARTSRCGARACGARDTHPGGKGTRAEGARGGGAVGRGGEEPRCRPRGAGGAAGARRLEQEEGGVPAAAQTSRPPRKVDTYSVSQLRRPRRLPGGPAGALGTRRSPAAAPPSPRRREARASRAPSPLACGPALCERGRPGGSRRLRARAEAAPPAGAAPSAAAGGRTRLGAERGVGGRLPPAAAASGLGAGPGRRPGGSAPSPAAGSARERSGAGAPPSAGRSGYRRGRPAPPPVPRRFAGAGGALVTEPGRRRCIVGAVQAAGRAARPLRLPLQPPTRPSSPRPPRPAERAAGNREATGAPRSRERNLP